jgi:K(+)-stimulated pyrophosphate-energized sodium pump
MIMIDADGNKTEISANQSKQINATEVSREVYVDMSVDGNVTTANVTIETTQNGTMTKEVKTFIGTEAEVEAAIATLKDVKVTVLN